MYKNKFVMAILINGKPQAEGKNGEVVVPFGSNYSIRFRNKHNKRCVVKFTIDGENVSGNGYVIPANGHIDIERFNDINEKFMFVASDSESAIDHGKNRTHQSNGVIRAKFYLETDEISDLIDELIKRPRYPYNPPWDPWWPGRIPNNPWRDPWWDRPHILYRSSPECKLTCNDNSKKELFNPIGTFGSNELSLEDFGTDSITGQNQVDGVTVEGGKSSQRFGSTHVNYSHSPDAEITLKLVNKLTNVDIVCLSSCDNEAEFSKTSQPQAECETDKAEILKRIKEMTKELESLKQALS